MRTILRRTLASLVAPDGKPRAAPGYGWQAPSFFLALGVSTMGCDTVVGVGVGVSYPGPMYGPYPLISMPGGPIVY